MKGGNKDRPFRIDKRHNNVTYDVYAPTDLEKLFKRHPDHNILASAYDFGGDRKIAVATFNGEVKQIRKAVKAIAGQLCLDDAQYTSLGQGMGFIAPINGGKVVLGVTIELIMDGGKIRGYDWTISLDDEGYTGGIYNIPLQELTKALIVACRPVTATRLERWGFRLKEFGSNWLQHVERSVFVQEYYAANTSMPVRWAMTDGRPLWICYQIRRHVGKPLRGIDRAMDVLHLEWLGQ